MRVSSVSSTRMYCARLGTSSADQLFGGQAEAEVIREGREIVDAIGEGDALRIGFDLAGFFDAGVQIADDRIGFEDDFAIEFQDYPQNAVRGWMLRSHIEDHRLGRADGRLDFVVVVIVQAVSALLAKAFSRIVLA